MARSKVLVPLVPPACAVQRRTGDTESSVPPGDSTAARRDPPGKEFYPSNPAMGAAGSRDFQPGMIFLKFRKRFSSIWEWLEMVEEAELISRLARDAHPSLPPPPLGSIGIFLSQKPLGRLTPGSGCSFPCSRSAGIIYISPDSLPARGDAEAAGHGGKRWEGQELSLQGDTFSSGSAQPPREEPRQNWG